MRKYLLAAAVFLVPFLIGLLFVVRSRRTAQEYQSYWKVARPIGPNHQSEADDLHLPAGIAAALRLLLNDQRLQGSHLQGMARKPGDLVSDADLAERPDLSGAAKGSQIYFYVVKEDATPIGGWSENALVIPCFQKPSAKPSVTKPETVCIHIPIRILAIHKSRTSGEGSWLALEIPEKLRCTFAEFALADHRIIYQVNAAR